MRRDTGTFAPDKHRARIACLRRSVGFAARGHVTRADGFRPDTVLMLTLTYERGEDWRPMHVARLLDHFRRWCKSNDIPARYVWVAELQKRGAIHYHVAVWVPRDLRVPSPDDAGWWPHGATNVVRARSAPAYLMKYLSKGTNVQGMPKGARMYGVGGLEHSMRRAARWLRYPAFIKARADILDDWKRARGGGWWSPDGFVVPSEFERVWLGDRYGLRRVADYGRPFDAQGPFSWLHRSPAHAPKDSQ
jgi:hypothetical protein